MTNKDTAFKINLRITITVTPIIPAPAAEPLYRTPVNSSTIAAVGYDRAARVLEIEFRSGRAYAYADVSYRVYRDFMDSRSMGSHFNQEIRGQYVTTKIADAK
jgi:hypothetical protein